MFKCANKIITPITRTHIISICYMTKLLDLISYNRRGKLASCWNAVINETLFKNFYGSAYVQKINVEEICNEIMKEIKNKPPTLNLKQASQLMYGVIKIFKDQVTKYEKDIFEAIKKLFSKPRKKPVDQFISDPVPVCDDLIDLPFSSERHLISRLGNRKDLHLLQEIDLEQVFMEAQARLDFGVLIKEEMDVLIDRIPTARVRDSVNWETNIINDIEISREVYRERHMSQEPNLLVNVEERREGLPLTPQKRQPRHVQAETPTKRRRLSLEIAVATDVVPPENTVTVPDQVTVPEIHVTAAEEMEVPEIMEIEELEIEENRRRLVRRPKKLVIDKNIILKNNVMKQWQQNTRIYCGKLEEPKLYHVNATDLFKQPAKRWGTTLKKHVFDKYIKSGPFTRATENFTLPAVQEAPEQVIRTSPMERSRNISEMQSLLAADNSAHNISIQPTIVNDRIQEVEEGSAIQLATESIPHMTTLEDNINIEPHQDQGKITDANPVPLDAERQRQTTEDRMSESNLSQVELTLDDVLAMVKKETQNTEFITLEQLVSIDKYSKEEVAITFYLLLVAHTQKKVVLQQEAYLADLWIRKYPIYSDSD